MKLLLYILLIGSSLMSSFADNNIQIQYATPPGKTPWEMDKAHSNFEFSVQHMMISKVKGRFKDFTINMLSPINDSEENFLNSKVNIEIVVNSITTDNTDRDEHLKSKDFLNGDAYPRIVYNGEFIKQLNKTTYIMRGDMHIHGIIKTLQFKVKYNGMGENMYGKKIAGFTIKGTVNKKDFGIVWNRFLDSGGLLIGENIEFKSDVEMICTTCFSSTH